MKHHLSFLWLWQRSDEMNLKSRDLGCELVKRLQQLLLGLPIEPDLYYHDDHDDQEKHHHHHHDYNYHHYNDDYDKNG